jgi:hypothetical protein
VIIEITTNEINNETVSGTIKVSILSDTAWAYWSASNTPASQLITRKSYDIEMADEWHLKLPSGVAEELIAVHLNETGTVVND